MVRKLYRAWLRRRDRLAPDVAGGVDDQAELGDLVVVGQRVALEGGGEAVLAGQADLIQRDVLAGLVDADRRLPGAGRVPVRPRHRGVHGYIPIPHLAWARAAPWGVYFTGLSRCYKSSSHMTWDRLFEQYIGRQLRLLPCAWVLPEITYGPESSRRTVDWIVVLSEVVLLVEVKSAIPAEPVRLGTLDAANAVLRKLGKAVRAHRNPQARDTAADPHRNPTDETAHSGTLVMRVKGTENSRSAASMRVSWAVGAFSR